MMEEVQTTCIPRVANYELRHENNEQDIHNLDTRIADLQRRNEESMSKELRIILEELRKVDNRVFSTQRGEELINTLQSADLRSYYTLLWNFLMNHFVSHRVCNTVYEKQAEPFTEILHVFEEVSFSQPIQHELPFFGDMTKKPYTIIERFGQRLESLSKNISHKIGQSNINRDDLIHDFIEYTI